MNKKRKFSNLFKKLKKVKLGYKLIFIITTIIYLASLSLLIYNILLLTGIETLLRVFVIITLIIYFVIFLILSLVLLISKKNVKAIVICIVTFIFAAINLLISYYIDKTYNIVDDLSKDKIIYTTDLITLNKDIDIKTVGILKNEEDVEGYILPQEYIASNNKKYKITNYENNELLLKALYNGEIDAAFIINIFIQK